MESLEFIIVTCVAVIILILIVASLAIHIVRKHTYKYPSIEEIQSEGKTQPREAFNVILLYPKNLLQETGTPLPNIMTQQAYAISYDSYNDSTSNYCLPSCHYNHHGVILTGNHHSPNISTNPITLPPYFITC